MAEPQTGESLAKNPSLSPLFRSSFSATAAAADSVPSVHTLPPPLVSAAASDSGNVGIEDLDLVREPKRRKHCPSALENLDELTSASNSSFSFTFDTKFCGFSAEITPKFGSFNSIAQELEAKKEEQCSVLKLTRKVSESKQESVHLQEEEEEEIKVTDALLETIGGGGIESVGD